MPLSDAEYRNRVACFLKFNRNATEACRHYVTLDGKRVKGAAMRQSILDARAMGLIPDIIQTPTQFDDTTPPEAPKLRITVSNMKSEPGWSGDILAIGDMHDSPRMDKRRFLWCGRAAVDLKVDRIIQIGDILSVDSLCSMEGNDTLRGKDKPSFEADIQSGHEALSAFDRGLQGSIVHKHITLGNHEDRLISFTNRTPEVAGILTGMVDNLFRSHKWTYSPYGVLYFIGSVAFVHAPLNIMRKAYGGKTAINRIGNDSVHDIVYGHTHKGGDLPIPKIGTNQKITVVDLGCALPEGHVEPYVGHATSGWKYGVNLLKIRDGRISSTSFITMTELEERFGD